MEPGPGFGPDVRGGDRVKAAASPIIAVIIPAYRAAAHVAEAVASALNQSRPPSAVVVVSDGCPVGGYENLLEPFGDWVRLIELPQNVGVSAARNAGVRAVDAEAACFLDADDTLEPAALAAVAQRLAEGADVVGIGLRAFDGASRARETVVRNAGFWPDPLRGLVTGSSTSTSQLTVRTEAFEAVGGFDPELRHCEDWDLLLRLAAAGRRFAEVREGLVNYRRHPGQVSDDLPAMAAGWRATLKKASLYLPREGDYRRVARDSKWGMCAKLWREGHRGPSPCGGWAQAALGPLALARGRLRGVIQTVNLGQLRLTPGAAFPLNPGPSNRFSQDPIFIGTPSETFTPTRSGALATIMHEWSRVCLKEGRDPLVVANASEAHPFADVNSVLLSRPEPPTGLWLTGRRIERRVRGWTGLDQGRWMRSVGDVLKSREASGRPWIVLNGPELAVYLRRRFPEAWILQHFENQLDAKPAARRAYPSAVNRTSAVSGYTADWVAERYGISRSSLDVVLNGTDCTTFCPATEKAPGPLVLQFVGRTGIEKGPDLLLSAGALLVTKYGIDPQAFEIRIIGSNHFNGYSEDEYQLKLRSLADEAREIGVKVNFLGHIDRKSLPSLMRQAHIHVVPSRWDEPFGLTTVEGMASGLATVASDTGGTPEVVGDGGILFRRDDEKSLACSLRDLVTSAEKRRDFSGRARSRAAELTWEASWEGMKRLLPG